MMLKSFFIITLLSLNFSAFAEEPEIVSKEVKAEPLEITVYRSPSCGCCSKWISHLKENDFKVTDIVTENVQGIKNQYHVPQNMASCHTAVVNGYVVEGHVPAQDIKSLLKIKPKIIGISVPAMPVGTPGMEMGTKKDAYNVVSFDENNQTQIFTHYEAEK